MQDFNIIIHIIAKHFISDIKGEEINNSKRV